MKPTPLTPPGSPSPAAPAPVDARRCSSGSTTALKGNLGLMAFLVLLASLPYAGILLNGFVYDDDTQVLRNPYIRNFSHLKLIFTTTVWSFRGGAQGVTNYYRPVMTCTYAACHAFFGFHAAGFHLASLAINAAAVCLVFVVARRIFHDRSLALLSAALFALHPIHTEAVDWIAAVTDLEAALFLLLAFWCFLNLESAKGKRWAMWQVTMLAGYVLALLSKESAAVLPALAVLYEHACREDRRQTSFSTKIGRYAGLWLALAAYLVARTHFLGAFAPVAPRRNAAFNEIALSALALAGHYVEKMFWPVRLCAAYVFPASLAALLPRILVGLAVIVICALLMAYFWELDRRVFFACAWFFITLAPVLNIRWMPDFAFAERYLYLPSVGFCWVMGWLGLKLWRWCSAQGIRWKLAAFTLAGGLTLLMIIRIAIRSQDWKNDLAFYQSTLAASPRALMIRNDLGNSYWDQEDIADAARQWEAAYQIDPNAIYVLDNLGLLRLKQKRYEEASVFFERSLAVSPDDEGAHTGLGETYAALGQKQKAEEELLAAIKLAPLDVRPRVRLGELYFDEARYSEACAQFQASNRSMPTPRAEYGLGLAEWMRGDRVDAESAFKSALQIDPGGARPHFMLGLFYGATGRMADGIREYQAGLRVDPSDKSAQVALAKLQAQAANTKERR